LVADGREMSPDALTLPVILAVSVMPFLEIVPIDIVPSWQLRQVSDIGPGTPTTVCDRVDPVVPPAVPEP